MSVPPVAGYTGWYTGSGWSSTGWTNAASPGTNNITTFTANNILASVDATTGLPYVYGGVASSITLPFTWTTATPYTFFHVAKYNGPAKNRIFQAKSSNWLSGYWNGKVGVAYREGWLTQFATSAFDNKMWMVSADRPTKFRCNGIDKTTTFNAGAAPNIIVIGPAGNQSTETSDWAVSEIIVYTSTLSDADVKSVENYLMVKYLNSVPDFVDLSLSDVLNKLYNRTTPLTTGSLLELYRDNGAVTTHIDSMPVYGNGSGTVSLLSAKYKYRNPLLFRLSATNLKQRVASTSDTSGIANGGVVTTWVDEINKYSATATGTTYLQYDAFYQYHYIDLTGANHITLPALTLKYRDHANAPIQGFTVVAVAKFNNATQSWARIFDFGNGQGNDNLLLARNSTSNTMRIHLYNGDSSNTIMDVANVIDLNLHVWTAVVNNVALTLSLYKDGVLISTAAMTAALSNRTSSSNFLGKSNWSYDAIFNGRMVDFEFYSQPLTTSELLAVHTSALKRYAIALPLMPGLMYRAYDGYFADDPTYFTSNTATHTGTTGNILNVYNGTEGIKTVDVSQWYSVEWFGYFRATATGTWTFYIASDDASFMWLGPTALSGYTTANALIKNPNAHPVILVSNTISLTAGEYYPIRVQYGQGAGGADCQVSFTPPGGTRTYDGTGYYFTGTGFSSLYPGLSAASLKAITKVNVNGNFWLLVNGTSTSTFCAMSTI